MNTSNRKFGSGVFIIFMLLASSYVFAQEVGKVTYVEGRVDYLKADPVMAVPVREGDAVSIGDTIRTKSNARAELTFRDKSIVRLAQDSRLEVSDYQMDKDSRRITATVKLERGKARSIISKSAKAPADFNIRTPNAEGKVRGSDIFTYYQAGASGMLVADGKLSVSSSAYPEKIVVVPAGSSVLIPSKGLPTDPRQYLEMEKKSYEKDTNPPGSIVKTDRSTAIKGAITKISGDVKVTAKGTDEERKAGINDILGEGDRIETGENGFVEIRFDNNNAINLKPKTNFLIIKMTLNLSTGEYENVFEVTIGKIKARIEGLPGKSKFEVKTPIAICSARGTILYINVSPVDTSLFVEGGTGYIVNSVSGAVKDVTAGENVTTANNGIVSDPVNTTQEERQSVGEGWEPGSGVEGYSAPGGAAVNPDTGTGAGADAGAADAIATADTAKPANETPDSPPITETTNLTTGTSTGTSGGETFNLGIFQTSTNNMSLVAADNFWSGTESVIGMIEGSFINPNNYSLWYDNGDMTMTTDDGTKILGGIGGTKVDSDLEGLFYGIYIRPNGKAGYIKLSNGNLRGNFDSLPGTFEASGMFTAYPKWTTTINPENLYYGSPFVDDSVIFGNVGGDFSGTMDGHSFSLIESLGQRSLYWGVWNAESSGTYSGTISENWKSVAGGSDVDGYRSDYWFVTMSGTKWADGKLGGAIDGMNISYEDSRPINESALGIISGDMIGTYGLGSWQALSCGVNDEAPLAFGGDTTHENGVDYALFGGTSSLWSGSPQATFIGDFNSQQVPSYNIWRFHPLGRTLDNGAIYGVAGGTNVNNVFKGLLYALYIRPDPDIPGQYLAGYLKSTNVAGNIYPDIDMFSAQADLTAIQMGRTNVSADQLLAYMSNDVWNDRTGYIYRDADDNGQVSGDIVGTFSGESINIDYSLTDQAWCIWREESSGTYQAEPQGAWHAIFGDSDAESGDTGYFLGHINGPSWSANEFRGDVTGRNIWYSPGHFEISSMGSVTGETIGTYANGAWSATSIGITDELPLAFGGDTTPESGIDYALFGGTESLWLGSPGILFIGDYNPQETPSGSLWEFHTLGKTSDGASIYGMAGGTNSGNALKGLMYAIYIRPDPGNPGQYLTGYLETTDIAGNFYPDISMFEADGAITATSIGQTTVTPGQLSASLDQHDLSGLDDHGGFSSGDNDTDIYVNAGSGTILNITQQNWGIWSLATGGTYQGPVSDTWDVYDLTGMITTTNSMEAGGSWLGGIAGDSASGGKWSDGEINGTLDAVWIQLRKDGTLSGRALSGPVIGNYVEAPGDTGTWQAAGAGEWVEVDSLLDTTNPANLTNDIVAVGQSVNIPITETYSSVMAGAGGGITSLTMDTHLYSMGVPLGGADGIWAAIINGTYSTAPTTDWTVTVANGLDNATLSGPGWSGSQWAAGVTGTVGGANITGKAAGTYDSGGAFTGAATGTCEG